VVVKIERFINVDFNLSYEITKMAKHRYPEFVGIVEHVYLDGAEE